MRVSYAPCFVLSYCRSWVTSYSEEQWLTRLLWEICLTKHLPKILPESCSKLKIIYSENIPPFWLQIFFHGPTPWGTLLSLLHQLALVSMFSYNHLLPVVGASSPNLPWHFLGMLCYALPSPNPSPPRAFGCITLDHLTRWNLCSSLLAFQRNYLLILSSCLRTYTRHGEKWRVIGRNTVCNTANKSHPGTQRKILQLPISSPPSQWLHTTYQLIYTWHPRAGPDMWFEKSQCHNKGSARAIKSRTSMNGYITLVNILLRRPEIALKMFRVDVKLRLNSPEMLQRWTFLFCAVVLLCQASYWDLP